MKGEIEVVIIFFFVAVNYQPYFILLYVAVLGPLTSKHKLFVQNMLVPEALNLFTTVKLF